MSTREHTHADLTLLTLIRAARHAGNPRTCAELWADTGDSYKYGRLKFETLVGVVQWQPLRCNSQHSLCINYRLRPRFSLKRG
jgi:hypothetical protein